MIETAEKIKKNRKTKPYQSKQNETRPAAHIRTHNSPTDGVQQEGPEDGQHLKHHVPVSRGEVGRGEEEEEGGASRLAGTLCT